MCAQRRLPDRCGGCPQRWATGKVRPGGAQRKGPAPAVRNTHAPAVRPGGVSVKLPAVARTGTGDDRAAARPAPVVWGGVRDDTQGL
jgi:hypothetical protein